MAARKAKNSAMRKTRVPVFQYRKPPLVLKIGKMRTLPPLPANLGMLQCCWDLNNFMVETAAWMASVQRAIWGGSSEVPPDPPKWPPK